MAKSINKKRDKGCAGQRYLDLSLAICNRYELKYKGNDSLWYALISWNKYGKQGLYEYMDECIRFDKANNNNKRIKLWNQLLIQELTVEEILEYADREQKKVILQLQQEIKEQMKNLK